MKRKLALFVFAAIVAMSAAPAHAHTKVCRAIPHGERCYVDGHPYSISCQRGYRVDPPGFGFRCVKVTQ